MADGNPRTFTDEQTGDLIIDDGERQQSRTAQTGPHFQNLASALPESTLDQLTMSVSELVAWDQNGRREWEELLAENINLLGLGPESKPDDIEYENSDTSDHPLMLTALIRFQSKALSALLPLPDRVCHTECALDLDDIEDEDMKDEIEEAAKGAGLRVSKFMADYLLKKHGSYRQDTDRILWECGMNGIGIRKVYNDYSRTRQKTRVEQVPIENLILSFDTRTFQCGRITQIIDMPTPDIIRNIRNGTFRPVELTIGSDNDVGPKEIAEDRIQNMVEDLRRDGETHRIYECYLDLILEDDLHPDGLARPYVMTIHPTSQKILNLRRNWKQGDPDETPIERYVGYIFAPGKTPVMGLGLGHILANITRALRRAQRRALESAYLQNHPSGYKLSTLKIRDDATVIRPGEFADVDTPVNDIRSAIMLHPFEGPSPGLMALSEKMEQAGRELGGIASIDFSQLMKAGIAAGPALAAYDESTEFQTAIHARLYHGHASELRLIMDRMREVYGNQPVPFGSNSSLRPGDLTLVNLTPIMQPGQISRQRQILEAQTMLEVANQYPDIVDRRKAVEEYVLAVGKTDASLYLLPDPQEMPPPEPADPVTEYQRILNDQPVRAGPQQNHQAHIDAHAAQMRIVQNSQLPVEKGEQAMAQLAAHIAEHMGLQLLVDVASKLGIPMEQFQDPAMMQQMETQIAPMVAEEIAAFEAEHRPPEGQEESKTQIEMVKGQNKMAETSLKHRQAMELEDVKARHARELQEQKDAAALERAEQDDETAIEIASMKDANKASTKAGTLSS